MTAQITLMYMVVIVKRCSFVVSECCSSIVSMLSVHQLYRKKGSHYSPTSLPVASFPDKCLCMVVNRMHVCGVCGGGCIQCTPFWDECACMVFATTCLHVLFYVTHVKNSGSTQSPYNRVQIHVLSYLCLYSCYQLS